ncbi:MAG: hypothetical protein D8H91_09655, partial [Alloprevotella sp.]
TQIYCQIYSNLLPDLLKSVAGFTQIYYQIYSNLLPDLLNSVYKFTQFPLFLQRKVRKIQGFSSNKYFVIGNNNTMVNERCPTKQNPCIATPSKTEAQMQGKQLCNKKISMERDKRYYHLNVFVKPNEQNRACSSYAMARKGRMKSKP